MRLDLMTRVTRRAGGFMAVALLTVALTGMRPGSDLPPEAAETRRILAEVERALAANEPVTLDWKTMAALNYTNGQMPETLRKLNGAVVRIPGFMVPLEDWEEKVTEFILVPFFGACIHVPPPPPNQMAHVLMGGNQKVAVNLWDPVWVTGKLKIENVESPYGVVGYQLSGQTIKPYDG